MRSFTVELSSQEHTEHLDEIVSFVGQDASGSFGILAHRAPLATALAWGLCRLRAANGAEHYLALPGGILLFDGSRLHIAARRYVRGSDPHEILRSLTEEEARESRSVHELHELFRRLDRELLQRLL